LATIVVAYSEGGSMLPPIEAQVVDARHLELRDPIRIRPGSQIVITILEAADEAEAEEWHQLAAHGLADAFSVSEPDYPVTMIKSPNVEYKP
jgi:hypothetical protein